MPLPKPIPISFGTDGDAALEKYVWNQITSLKSALNTLHNDKVTKWRKWYRGVAEQEERTFPWKNASNLVVQLIGTHVDMLRARVLASMFEVLPIFKTELVGTWDAAQQGEEQRNAIEKFMNIMALEPAELDLYRVESQAADECIKFGTVFIKDPWETRTEMMVAGVQEGKLIETEKVIYDGPRPEKIPFEDMLVTPSANTLEVAPFKAHVLHLTKQQLEYRAFVGVYDSDVIMGSRDGEGKRKSGIIENPDNSGRPKSEQTKEQDKGIHEPDGFENPTWDIYECWFEYVNNGKKYKLGPVTYHLSTRQFLRKAFNFYPNNEEPFDMGRLGYTEDGLYGLGYCEMLAHYQQELTTLHNQSIDNNTLLNTSVLRVSRNSKLDSNFSIFPMAILPGEEGEIEKIQLGSAAPDSLNLQKLILDLARMRSGVEPGSSGSGGGVTNPRKGNYSAMGTFSVMQEGNRRSNINITDMRYLHLKLGRKFLRQYAEFGVGRERIAPFGMDAQYIIKALESIKNGRLALPIRAATASVNKELEKQNDILLTQIMMRQQQATAGILESINNPMMPDVIKNYLVGVIAANCQLMGHILRNFGHDDTSRLLPEERLLKGAGNGNGQSGQNSTGTTGQGNTGDGMVQNDGNSSSPAAAPPSVGGTQTGVPIP